MLKSLDNHGANVLKITKHFINKEIEITIDLQYKSEETTEEGVLMTSSPLSMRGYLIDLDEEYLYLGETLEEVTNFVLKSRVVGGQLVFDEIDERLNNMPTNGVVN